MTAVDRVKNDIQGLSRQELAELRRWFSEYDWERWDHELEDDVAAGKLDALATKAIDEDSRRARATDELRSLKGALKVGPGDIAEDIRRWREGVLFSREELQQLHAAVRASREGDPAKAVEFVEMLVEREEP